MNHCLILSLTAITICNYLSIDVQADCTDNEDLFVEEGQLYVPGPNECLLCLCKQSGPQDCEETECQMPPSSVERLQPESRGEIQETESPKFLNSPEEQNRFTLINYKTHYRRHHRTHFNTHFNTHKPVKTEFQVVAIDCEMVGINPDGRGNMLARVSIVNSKGATLYDKFVKPTKNVTDYRTPVSGVRREDIENGELFATVKRDVSILLKNKLLVGHAVGNDLKVLNISHPNYMIRDTSKYWKFKQFTNGKPPGLKQLTSHFLGANIQSGEHSSVQDAKAALQLYMLVRKDWEMLIKKRRNRPRNGHKPHHGGSHKKPTSHTNQTSHK